MVADAWFSKRTFVDPILSMDMHLISRMRNYADLRYISTEEPTGKRGRPRKFASKIIIDNIDKDYFTCISQDQESTVYSAEVYSKALKPITVSLFSLFCKLYSINF
jgi:hypothetical protein